MFPNIEEIILSNNRLGAIDWEAFRLYKLRRLILSYNSLTAINEHMLRFTPNLEVLDLSHNYLIHVQSSNFFSAQKLRSINLSYNHIKRFDYDSFSPLYQLQTLDLSYNEFINVPAGDLRQLVGLRTLNLSGNAFDRILDGDFVHPVLQELVLSNCHSLRLIESNAFFGLPYLTLIDLSWASSLVYISPQAFANNTLLYRIILTHTQLETIPKHLYTVPKIAINDNPFQCGCVAKMVKKFQDHIIDVANASCFMLEGTRKRLSESIEKIDEPCRPEPIVPFGEVLSATVGQYFSLYCASRNFDDIVLWRFPNGTEIIANNATQLSPSKPANIYDLFPLAVNDPQNINSFSQTNQPRIFITKERIRFDVILMDDEGDYRCSLFLQIGSHYVALAWNGSLAIKASYRINLYLTVKDLSSAAGRSIQLSLHNPWLSYSVMRLKPNQNYTFCLVYILLESGFSKTIYETCTQETTAPSLSILNSLTLTTLLAFFIIMLLFCSLFFIKSLYVRLHIWQQQKYRSRMNQSISGQSFISTTSSTSRDASITYENQLSVNQSVPLYRFRISNPNILEEVTAEDLSTTENNAL
ncbi:unnamed protein product [Dracunculus medinensis]|uniref:Ig-like domain-containing protein n=1 Tax=Dracunculus medinensis TaxID=318479 RepID=A0A158Q4G4_DRAME|nr:unnamed protein product [Dracunculus medinensis]